MSVVVSVTVYEVTVKHVSGLILTSGGVKLKVDFEARSYSENATIGTSRLLDVTTAGHY